MKTRIIALLFLVAIAARAQTFTGNITTNGTTCATTNACVVATLPQNAGTVAVEVSGTYTGTLSFEATVSGATIVSTNCFAPNSTVPVTSTATTGVYQCSVAGMGSFWLRGSASITGSAAIQIKASPASAGSGSGRGGSGPVSVACGNINDDAMIQAALDANPSVRLVGPCMLTSGILTTRANTLSGDGMGTVVNFQTVAGGGPSTGVAIDATYTGTVNTNGTAVTWVTGKKFPAGLTNIGINGTLYPVASVDTNTGITLSGGGAGVQNGVTYITGFALAVNKLSWNGGATAAPGSQGTRSAIRVFNPAQQKTGAIQDNYIYGFSNSGIEMAGLSTTGGNPAGSGVFGNSFYWNYYGVNTCPGATPGATGCSSGITGEYATISGNFGFQNAICIHDDAGNVIINNNHCDNNTVGGFLVEDDSSNGGHSPLIGNTANHNGSYSIKVNALRDGIIIKGNALYGGDLYLYGAGIHLEGNQGSISTLTLYGYGGGFGAANVGGAVGTNVARDNSFSSITTFTTDGSWQTQLADIQNTGTGQFLAGQRAMKNSSNFTLGSEVVTDPNFADGSKWTQGAGWSVAGNAATATASSAILSQTATGCASLSLHQLYAFEITVSSYTGGSLYVALGGGGDGSPSYGSGFLAAGKVFGGGITTSLGTNGCYIVASGLTAAITEFSVWPVTYVNPILYFNTLDFHAPQIPPYTTIFKAAQTAAISATNLIVSVLTDSLYRYNFDLDCTTTSAAATVTTTVGWTDTSNTAQTSASSAATCTALGASSHIGGSVVFAAKAGTAITYATTIANTPTYNLRVVLEQLSGN